MSRRVCKSSWPISGCHHPHLGPQKTPGPHTGRGRGNESPEGIERGKGYTAPEINTAAGSHQTGKQRTAGDQAVIVIEKGPQPGLAVWVYVIALGVQVLPVGSIPTPAKVHVQLLRLQVAPMVKAGFSQCKSRLRQGDKGVWVAGLVGSAMLVPDCCRMAPLGSGVHMRLMLCRRRSRSHERHREREQLYDGDGRSSRR